MIDVNIADVSEEDLIDLMFRCYDRLRQRGWRDIMYAPTDNRRPLEVIEAGSTGIHKAQQDSKQRFWIADEFDTWPSRPILFREPKR